MSPNNKEKKNNRYKGKNRPSWRSGGYRKKRNESKVLFTCPVCNEGIREVGNAIDFQGQGPTHFDCVLRALTESEKLNKGEKVIYVGSGRFGVINNKKNDSGVPFTLLREIDVEDREKVLSWRDERKIDVSIEENVESDKPEKDPNESENGEVKVEAEDSSKQSEEK